MGEPIRVMPGEAPRKSNACLIGCIVSVAVGVVLIVAVVLIIVYVLNQVRDSFTSEAPEPLPQVEFTQEQAQEVQQRADALEAAMKDPSAPAQTIEMTAQDLNILLRSDPRVSAIGSSVYVDIAGDTLNAQLSLPLDSVPAMQGRYLNGTATIDVDVVNDKFVLSVQRFMMHGTEFPVAMLSQLEGEFNKNLNQQQEVRALAQRVESIQVQDGLVRITLKGGQP